MFAVWYADQRRPDAMVQRYGLDENRLLNAV